MSFDDILDAALDEYEKETVSASASNAPLISPSKSTSMIPPNASSDAAFEAEIINNPAKFASELQGLMAELNKGMSADASLPPANAEAMNATLQQLIEGLTKLPPAPISSASSSTTTAAIPVATATTSVEQSLEQMLRAVSEGTKSFKSGTRDANLNGGDMEKMDEMFKMFAGLDASGDIDPNDKASVDKMMSEMMGQMKHLFNKDVMKQPIMAMSEKYPAWLQENRSKYPPSEFKNFENQYACFQRMCVVFDKPDFDVSEVMMMMQEMQTYGNPPPEIMTDVGLTGADGTPPPVPADIAKELAQLDPKAMQEACKTQ